MTGRSGRDGGSPVRTLAIVSGLLAVVVAGVLAAVSIPTPHPGGDNAGYLALAHALATGQGYSELWDPARPPHTKYPPVLPLVLAGMILVGIRSWIGFKLVVAASAVSIAVLLAFLWAHGRRGPWFGAAVALLALLSAGWLEASRWILTEPLFLVFTLGSLVAAERGLGRGGEGGLPPGAGGPWLAASGGLALLAFFTRSAGFPLVLALVAAFALARRIRAAGILGGAFVLLAGAWFVRARSGGAGAYQDEFWMANPYDPALGTVGPMDLVGRVWNNLRLYVGEVLPGEWWGAVAAPGVLGILGVLVTGLAVAGWVRRLRPRPGPAELLVPAYLGLILVWPEVWSGDRFLLPLYPFALLYAGEVLVDAAGRRWRGAGSAVGAGAFLLLVVPAVAGWVEMADEAGACRAAGTDDVFVCHAPGVREFRDAAAWAGVNLPPGSVVLNRKPRVFHVLGGSPGRTFPFTRDPDALLAEADAASARYLLLDHVDGISGYYLPAVIQARPRAFCHIRGWGGRGGPGTDLFGILPPGERRTGGEVRELGPCPGTYRTLPPVEPRIEGTRVPILVP